MPKFIGFQTFSPSTTKPTHFFVLASSSCMHASHNPDVFRHRNFTLIFVKITFCFICSLYIKQANFITTSLVVQMNAFYVTRKLQQGYTKLKIVIYCFTEFFQDKTTLQKTEDDFIKTWKSKKGKQQLQYKYPCQIIKLNTLLLILTACPNL